MSPDKLFHQIFVAFDIILQLFIFKIFIVTSFRRISRVRNLVVSDLHSETKGSRFESGC